MAHEPPPAGQPPAQPGTPPTPATPATPSTSPARRRRRGLYGPPPRLTRTSPLTGRLVWHIGDWGRASEHIGARWEAVAGELARERLPQDEQLLVLAQTPGLMADVLGSGLPHADAIRAYRQDGALALEPLDFKWSLETASARQVSSETLARLLAAELASLAAALQAIRAALGLEPNAELAPTDGRFVAPVHPANHAALLAEPELPTLLLPVNPRDFFEPLPGWAAARALGRLESANLDRLSSIEAIERYYRLGAGVEGALSRVQTGVFETTPAHVDAETLIGDLRRRGKARTLNELLLHLQRELELRKALDERLNQLPRTAYPFGRLRSDLHKLGVPRAVLDSRGALGRAYAEATREMLTSIRSAGRELVAGGTTASQALDQLGSQTPRWASIGSAQAQIIAERLKG